MNFFAKYKNLTVIVVVILLLYLGYSYFFGGLSTGSTDLVAETAVSEGSEVGSDLLRTLLTLRSLTLDDRIFTDKGFISLKDFSQPITPLPVGRKNPFAPFGGQSATPSGTRSTH